MKPMPAYPTLIMIAPRGGHPAQEWMAEARTAAAADLWARLSQVGGVDVVVDAADPADREAFTELGAALAPASTGEFHFGRRIRDLCSENGWKRLAYFGGSSAPLLTPQALSEIFEQASDLGDQAGLVNNLHSSDWLVINDTSAFASLVERLPKDNMLGWVLAQEAGYSVSALPPDTPNRADLDTPADVIMVGRHALAGERLRRFAASAGGSLQARIENLEHALIVPGNSLAVIGRASSQVWARLESQLAVWVRCYVEERGMVASGRLASGSVRSLVAEALETWGAEQFIRNLEELVQAAVWEFARLDGAPRPLAVRVG